MKRGKDFIKVVESSTTYRNPSIYEKLVEHLHINEKGWLFPAEFHRGKLSPGTVFPNLVIFLLYIKKTGGSSTECNQSN